MKAAPTHARPGTFARRDQAEGNNNNPAALGTGSPKPFGFLRNEPIVEIARRCHGPGTTIIPASAIPNARPSLLIRYLPQGVPTISALKIGENRPPCCAIKPVFLGVTALSAARDRLMNPYGEKTSPESRCTHTRA